MKKFVYLLAVIFLLVGSSAYAGDVKIGLVDIIKALNLSDPGKKAKADLETLIQAKQDAINEKGLAIETMRGDLEKQSSVLSPEARKTREEELEQAIKEYQRLVTDSQTEVKKKESRFTLDIVKDLRKIISKIGEEENYTIILVKADELVLYSKKGIDLTDTVMKRYNKSKAVAGE